MNTYIHIPLWDFSHSGDNTIDGLSPAREDNYAVGLAPTLEVPDRQPGRGPYPR